MCKHKSGGMNKPSGTTSHDGLSERTTASMSSQGCPQSTSITPNSQVPHSIVLNQDTSCSSQVRKFSTTAVVNMQLVNCSNSCDTYSFLSNNDNSPCDSKQYEGMPFMPNVQESPQEFLESQDSDDDETEQSPMLLKEACGMYCSPPDQWHPEEELAQNILNPNHFNACDPYPYSAMDHREKATNCDNFPLYHKYRARTTIQEPVSYIQTPYRAVACPSYFESTINNFDEHPVAGLNELNYESKHKKKWLLNQKCKSADSEPDSFSSRLSSVCRQGVPPIGYNYVQGHSTNILETHINECNPYLKPVYTNNGDPIAGPSGLQRPCSINWEIGANSGDSEFRSRSYSLTPTINFAVFESESSSETEDVQEPMVPEPVEIPTLNDASGKTIDDPFELPVISLGKVLPISPSAAQLSIASSYGDNGSPICKICHMTARENDPLISPCRCSGTMQYIHCGCLMRWLEVCHKRGRRPASCELCQYQYHWHKKFKIRHWQFPQCSRKDKILHFVFIFSALLMITCASLTVMFFKQDKGTKVDLHQELTQSEIGNLVCGVLFFVAFFVAIYVEAKSHETMYQLVVRFIHINQQWYIDEYEKKEPSPVAV